MKNCSTILAFDDVGVWRRERRDGGLSREMTIDIRRDKRALRDNDGHRKRSGVCSRSLMI